MTNDWTHTKVAADGSHHELDGRPFYAARFSEVLKFHAPGLAPVRDDSGAYHIDPNGIAAYNARYLRSFGFYEGLAAVETGDGWCHVLPNGNAAYALRHEWCGNFQGGWCPVRTVKGHYHHIDRRGRPLSSRSWAYAGDFRDGIAVVQAAEGQCSHIDEQDALLHGQWFDDLDVFHKGFARARDASGWMHIDRSGRPIYERRFAAVEPFYNGQARVECLDGAREVIDEGGRPLVRLRPATSGGA